MVKIQIRLQPLRSVHNILDARCLIPDTRCGMQDFVGEADGNLYLVSCTPPPHKALGGQVWHPET